MGQTSKPCEENHGYESSLCHQTTLQFKDNRRSNAFNVHFQKHVPEGRLVVALHTVVLQPLVLEAAMISSDRLVQFLVLSQLSLQQGQHGQADRLLSAHLWEK